MKIVTVIGARPQFIKAAVVSRQFLRIGGVTEYILHTGQHYDENMSGVFFKELGIPEPTFHFEIGGGTHGAMTGRMLEAIEKVLLDVKPDAVLVYGDTNSTIAGALAAVKLHQPVAHVEAGLRSFNRRMPEEINRVVTDHVSTWLLAPTDAAVRNLRHEGVDPRKIHLVGDVMFDAAIYYGQRTSDAILETLSLRSKQFILATIHRAENTDSETNLRTIVEGLKAVARHLPIVLPIHPRTRKVLANAGLDLSSDSHIRVIDPVGYLDMVALEKHASLIVTDSGGVQKEAFFHGVPCVTLRGETEWVELVEIGWNRLVPPKQSRDIVEAAELFLGNAPSKDAAPTLYGGGKAGERIVELLYDALKGRTTAAA